MRPGDKVLRVRIKRLDTTLDRLKDEGAMVMTTKRVQSTRRRENGKERQRTVVLIVYRMPAMAVTCRRK